MHLIFDQPVTLRRIHLRFDERERERTQEFTLAWRSAAERDRAPAVELQPERVNYRG